MNLIKSAKRQILHFIIDHYPKIFIDKNWQARYGHKIDWDNPRNINEKMQWLICYGDTSEWPRLADKYCVREYIKEKGYGDTLVKLYGAWERAEDIDFDSLPEKFVLKCNHDSASTKIVDKSQGVDREELVRFYSARLKQKYGYTNCEPHYNKIKPLVMAEEFLQQEPPFKSLTDYKFWCFDGKAYYVLVMFDRTRETVSKIIYDLDWNPHPEFLKSYGHFKPDSHFLPKPQRFEEMISMANHLSEGFPEVRVDLYEINGKIYFGELTFTGAGGRMVYADSFLKELGSYCVI